MAIHNNAAFQLEFSAKDTGASATLKGILAELEKIRSTQKELGLDTAKTDAAIESAQQSLSKIVKKGGEEAHEAGLSHHELHQSFKLAGMAAGEALGPIGELGHFIGSPYILAVSGAVLAVHMLIEQHEKLHDALVETIAKGREQAELFASSHVDAIRANARALAQWTLEQQHARDAIDELTEGLKRHEIALQGALQKTEAVLDAQLRLTKAYIEAEVAAGRMSKVSGDAMTQRAEQHTRDLKQAHEYAEKMSEAQGKEKRATQAEGESATAQARLPAARAEVQRLGEMIDDVNKLAAAAEKDLPALQKAYDEAKAKAAESSHRLPTAADEAKYEEYKKTITTGNFALTPGSNNYNVAIQDYIRDHFGTSVQDQRNLEKAKKAFEDKQNYIEGQKDYAGDIGDKQKAVQKDIDSLQSLILERDKLAESLRKESDAIQDEVARISSQNKATNAIDDRAAMVKHISDLEQSINKGTATPKEQAEYNEYQSASRNPGGINQTMMRRVGQRLGEIEREEPGAQKKQDMDEFLGRILGVLDALAANPAIRNASDYSRRLESLEIQLSTNRGSPNG